jgi:hypothetical protein
MRIVLVMAAATAAMLVGSQAAIGLNLDSQGHVTDWDLTPFSRPNQSDLYTAGVWSTMSNDYSPVSFPGIGHFPAPGDPEGKCFDLEEIHLRYVNQHLEILVVTASPWAAVSNGNAYHLGDLFLSVNGQQYGVVTQLANTSLAAGSVYQIGSSADVVALESYSGSWIHYTKPVHNDYGPDAPVATVTGPWAVASGIGIGQFQGAASLHSAMFDYGGTGNGTFLLEYTLDPTLLGLQTASGNVSAQLAWGCGNDVIRVQANLTPTPEPASLALLAVGASLVAAARRSAAKREAA